MARFDSAAIVALFAILPVEHTPALRDLLCVLIGLRGAYLAIVRYQTPFLRRFGALLPWLMVASASYFWSAAPDKTLSHLTHDLWLPLLAMFGCYQIFRHTAKAEVLLWAVATATAINGILTVLGSPYATVSFPWAVSYFTTTGYSSTCALYFLALAIPWLLAPQQLAWHRYLAAAVVLVNTAAALVAHNRMFFIAMIVLLAALPWLAPVRIGRKLAWVAGAYAIALVAMLFIINNGRAPEMAGGLGVLDEALHMLERDPRVPIWKFWAARIADAPLLGEGFGRSVPRTALDGETRRAMEAVDPFATIHAHNIFLSTVVENGFVGLACFLWMLVQLSIQFLRGGARRNLGAASGLLLIGAMVLKNLTDVFMVFATAVLFYAAVGTALAWLRD